MEALRRTRLVRHSTRPMTYELTYPKPQPSLLNLTPLAGHRACKHSSDQ